MHVITGDQTVYTKGLYYKASADITALEACAILQIVNYTLNSQTPPPPPLLSACPLISLWHFLHQMFEVLHTYSWVHLSNAEGAGVVDFCPIYYSLFELQGQAVWLYIYIYACVLLSYVLLFVLVAGPCNIYIYVCFCPISLFQLQGHVIYIYMCFCPISLF